MREPLSKRRELLEKKVLPRVAEPVRYSAPLDADLPVLIHSVKGGRVRGPRCEEVHQRLRTRSTDWRVDEDAGELRTGVRDWRLHAGDADLRRANLRLLRGRQTDLRCYECPLPIFPEPRSGRWGQARTGGTGSIGPNVRPVNRDREDIVNNRSVIDAHHARHRWEVIVEPDPEQLLLVVITAYPIE